MDYAGIEGPGHGNRRPLIWSELALLRPVVNYTQVAANTTAVGPVAGKPGVWYTKVNSGVQTLTQGVMQKLTANPAKPASAVTGPAASQTVGPRAITDGLSKTMIVGEEAGRGFNGDTGNIKITGAWAAGSMHPGNVQNNSGGHADRKVFRPRLLATLTTNCLVQCLRRCGQADGAYHPSGGNILLCDGSVQFIPQETPAVMLWYLASRNGAETIEQGVIGGN